MCDSIGTKLCDHAFYRIFLRCLLYVLLYLKKCFCHSCIICFLYFIASREDISSTFTEVVEKISGVIKVMEELVPKMSEDESKRLGDIIERELKQMDLDIEEAAQRIQVCDTLH